MRLHAQARMGFYPTPDKVTPIIARYINRKEEGLIRVLDPCAGEGAAINLISGHLEGYSYGIEIDLERGEKAKRNITKCLVTDYQNTRISRHSFSLLWLNPPYDWAARDDEIEKSERYERTFLRDCVSYLCKGGILVYLIPQKRLDGHIARMLSYRFENIKIFRFPEEEYQSFKQVVIFGVLKKRPDKDDSTADYLKKCGKSETGVIYLPNQPSFIYQVPALISKAKFIFRSKDINKEELAEEIQEHGLFEQFRERTTPLMMGEKIRPVMPLRHGHLAQILACGLMNGVVWDNNKSNPLLVKGITKKEVKHTVEVHGDKEKHIETDQIKILINAFNRRGEMHTIQ